MAMQYLWKSMKLFMFPHDSHKNLETTINLQSVDVTFQTVVDFPRLHRN